MKKIYFIPYNDEVLGKITMPEPSLKKIPKWYKNSFKYYESNKISFCKKNEKPEFTVKSCIPVFDTLSMGYIQSTWTDIYIEQNENEILYRYASGPEIVSIRNQVVRQKLPAPIGCTDIMFDWKRYWIPKTPRGYSCMYIHPMYHNDLPFVTMPGIIDSDVWNGPGLNSPNFFIKKGFNGIIPKGTPMYQIIPFKRESWTSEKAKKEDFKHVLNSMNKIESMFVDRYKKMFWVRKVFK